MKVYGLMIRSGLSGVTVCVDANATHGDLPGQTLIHLAGYGDTIGHTLHRGERKYLPVAYELVDGEIKEVELPITISRMDAMRDVAQHLSDLNDNRLDLAWRESNR